MKKIIWPFVVAVLGLGFVLFETSESQVMQRRLLREIPLGTPPTSAQSVMEAQGYKCATYSPKAIDRPTLRLFCLRKERKTDSTAYTRSEVEFGDENNAVASVVVNIRQTPQ